MKEEHEQQKSNVPLVTCIITCYKKFDYLYEAIQSVIIQDYPKIELLITDDGSEFFPKEDVETYIKNNAKSNIKHFFVNHHPNNVGTVRNINSMLKIATGDYFIGLDGDDVFYDGTVFSRIVNRFIETGVDFLSCSRMQCDEQLNPIKLIPTAESKKLIKKMDTARKQYDSVSVFRFHDIASGSAMYFSRENLQRMGLFDENYRNWQDGPRIAEYIRRGKMIPTAFDITSVKYRDGGVSNNPSNNMDSFAHITKDRANYIRRVVSPNKTNRMVFLRRKILFWFKWDQAKTHYERILAMAEYPEQGICVLIKKIRNQSIR